MAAQLERRPPPHDSAPQPSNVEAEALLLSALMARNESVDMIADRLDPGDFAEHAHALIYQVIVEKISLGQPATPVTLSPYFRDEPALKELGGAAYLAQLSGTASLFARPRELADDIADLAARRRLIAELNAAAIAAADLGLALPRLVDMSDAALVAAVERRETWTEPTMGEATRAAMKRMEEVQASGGKMGVQTGQDEFDQLLGGLEPGNLIIVAGRPGMGKTAVACRIARGLGEAGHGVYWPSLEMNATELGTRMLSDLVFNPVDPRIPFSRILTGDLDMNEWRAIARAQQVSDAWPVRILDAGAVTLPKLALRVRRQKRRMKARGAELRVVIIDYLQLLVGEGKSKVEEVTNISRGLKMMAKDLGVAIVALAQLSRAVEQREDKRPKLSDLRESGQIEQDADAVLFLFREEYYLEQIKPTRGKEEEHEQRLSDVRGRLELILAKRRNGSTGIRTVEFLAPYQAIRSLKEPR